MLNLDITYEKVQDHYEIYVDGRFYCSCDNLTEVDTEIDHIRRAEQMVEGLGDTLEEIVPQIIQALVAMTEALENTLKDADWDQIMKVYLESCLEQTGFCDLEDSDYEK